MARRLYGFSYNKEQWTIKPVGYSGYQIKNNKTNKFVEILGNIVGIEQVSYDNFLIHRNKFGDFYHFSHIKISGNNLIELYKRDFSVFDFLTDDTIIFNNKTIYSISKNAEVEDFKWNTPEYYISVRETNDEKKVIFVEKKINSTEFSHLYVMVIVDGENFKPVSQAFSSLRNSFIPLSDDFTFDMLVKEDENYAKIISDIILAEDMLTNEKGCLYLFSQIPIHN